MDLYTKTISIVAIILIALTIFSSLSGCAVLRAARDTILGRTESQLSVPETSKGQLWQTIKGLTPNWLAIPVIALGAVAMFNGAAKLGMSCIIFGSVNLFMALATSRFGFWMAVCGLVGSGLAVAASILAKNKALKDIIGNVQGIKGWMGGHVDTPFENAVKEKLLEQTKSTKKIVAKIKTKMKLKEEIA